MKKLISVILALVMVLSLAACGGSKAPETTAPATEAPATEAPVSGLADAVAYVKTIYKTAEGAACDEPKDQGSRDGKALSCHH